MKLTKEFDLNVFVHSDTAQRLGIDNTPTPEAQSNLRALFDNLLLPMQNAMPGTFNVTSGYRCHKLNAAVKGKPESQHTKGMAVDVEYHEGGPEMNTAIIEWVKQSGIDFDQCINEYPDRNGNPRWVHLSYNPGKNRKMFVKIT